MLALLFMLVAAPSLAAEPAFDPKPWLEDLDQVHEALGSKYANLEWAVFEREADLPKLFAETRSRIAQAGSEIEARAAFDRFVRLLGDEHVAFSWPKSPAQAGSAADTCKALGYDARSRAAPLAADIAGYRPISSPQSDTFPAGLIQDHIGVLKIGVFMPEGFPALCEAALQALAVPADRPCDDACRDRVDHWVADRQTRDLMEQIRALNKAGATTLLVDIAGNGGGTEWAEAVARILTPIRLKSEEMDFVRGEHWAKHFAEDSESLRKYAGTATGSDRSMLLALADEADAKHAEALKPCDAAALWKGEHPPCRWLGKGFYGSGLLASADPATLRGKPWANDLFSPMEYPYEEGVWRGPLLVLVDRNVGSAAAEFTAVLQDNRAAIVIGEPTGGGCGHTDGGTPTVLSHSKATFNVPDCARMRADGSNEVMGIRPDVLVSFGSRDGPHQRAAHVLALLPAAVQRAAALSR
ncbi:MAG TPA: S41 family peptidase [Alphaproteobacteria bacterium]|jgi:hypothetical protein|nr:S41 family peptidase [Alphaproteobacteria bacterium]